MSAPVRVLTMGHPSALAPDPRWDGVVADLDVYALPDADLSGVRAVLVGVHADQIHLGRHRGVLDEFVDAGGRLAVCGQVTVPFGPGLSRFAALEYRGVADLTVHRLAPHPVWDGVDARDLTFRRGVAGFYGRGWYPDLPAGALVVHGLGPQARALDAVYRWGRGEVLLHGGNDLWGYGGDETTAARMTPQLLAWALA